MSADNIILALIVATLPPLTMFPIVFAVVARRTWYRTPAGRALMVSTTALAAVLYVVLARTVFGDYPYREVVLIVVFSGVCAGAWLKFGALVYESRRRLGPTSPDE